MSIFAEGEKLAKQIEEIADKIYRQAARLVGTQGVAAVSAGASLATTDLLFESVKTAPTHVQDQALEELIAATRNRFRDLQNGGAGGLPRGGRLN